MNNKNLKANYVKTKIGYKGQIRVNNNNKYLYRFIIPSFGARTTKEDAKKDAENEINSMLEINKNNII